MVPYCASNTLFDALHNKMIFLSFKIPKWCLFVRALLVYGQKHDRVLFPMCTCLYLIYHLTPSFKFPPSFPMYLIYMKIST
jgi:hypothetical protein